MREAMLHRAKSGPYRFLVRRWVELNDIDLAARVLACEPFTRDLAPLPLPIEDQTGLLVLAPHQDDELIGAGGTLILASRAGVPIHIVFITDGIERNPKFTKDHAQAGRIRDEEAAEVCKRLGAKCHHLGIGNIEPQPAITHLDTLSRLIDEIKPSAILAPWLLDSPAKHRMVHHLLWLVNFRKPLPATEIWGFQVHNTLIPNGIVDITPVAEEKRALLGCYRSQIEHNQSYDHLAMALSAWNSHLLPPAPTRRYAEAFCTLPHHEHLRLVDRFYFTNLQQTYRGNQSVIPGLSAIHKAVTGKWARPAR